MILPVLSFALATNLAFANPSETARFSLQGSSEHDYHVALEHAAVELSALLNVATAELPHLRIEVNRSSAESEQAVDAVDLRLADDLLAKNQRANETMASVVAHEACHLWLIELAKQKGLAQTKQGYLPSYGHAQFNDWFDEMAAVHCEQGDLASQRRVPDFEFIPLATYLTQMHPVYERMQAQISAALAAQKAKQTNSGNGQTVLKLTVKDDDFGDFYQQSAYFSEFLTTLDTNLEVMDWFALAQQQDPEVVAQRLGFASLTELEAAFYQFIPW